MSGPDETRRDLARRAEAGDEDAEFELALFEEGDDGRAAVLDDAIRGLLKKATGSRGETLTVERLAQIVREAVLEASRRIRGVTFHGWVGVDPGHEFWTVYAAWVVDIVSDMFVLGLGGGMAVPRTRLSHVWPEIGHPSDWKTWLVAPVTDRPSGPSPVRLLAEYPGTPAPFGFTLSAEERDRSGRGRLRTSADLALRWAALVLGGHVFERAKNVGPDEERRDVERRAASGDADARAELARLRSSDGTAGPADLTTWLSARLEAVQSRRPGGRLHLQHVAQAIQELGELNVRRPRITHIIYATVTSSGEPFAVACGCAPSDDVDRRVTFVFVFSPKGAGTAEFFVGEVREPHPHRADRLFVRGEDANAYASRESDESFTVPIDVASGWSAAVRSGRPPR